MSEKSRATYYPFVSLEDAMKDQTTQAADRSMPEQIRVTYTITSTYSRVLDVARISPNAPSFGGEHTDQQDWLDDMADWLENHPSDVELEVLHERDWVDTDAASVEISDVGAVSS